MNLRQLRKISQHSAIQFEKTPIGWFFTQITTKLRRLTRTGFSRKLQRRGKLDSDENDDSRQQISPEHNVRSINANHDAQRITTMLLFIQRIQLLNTNH